MSGVEHDQSLSLERYAMPPLPLGDGSFTRRDFIRRAVGSAIGVSGLTGVLVDRAELIRKGESYSQHQRLVEQLGFPKNYISEVRTQELFGTYGLAKLDSHHIRLPKIAFDPNNDIEEVSFTLENSASVIAEVKGVTDENISLWVLEAELGEVLYQLPNLQDKVNDSNKVIFGKLHEGDHSVRIRHTDTSQSLSEDDYSLQLSTVFGSKIFKTIVENVPLIGMRRDNYENGTTTNDMPLFCDVKIRERGDDGFLLVEYWQGYTKEEGGMGVDVRKMIKKFERAYDYDISIILLLDQDGEAHQIYFQTDNTKGHHQYEVLESLESSGSLPHSPLLHSIGKHGMLADGLQVNSEGRLITKVFGFYPDFSSDVKSQDNDIREIAYRVNALRQYHSMLISDLNNRLRFQQYTTGAVSGVRVADLVNDIDFVEKQLKLLDYPVARSYFSQE